LCMASIGFVGCDFGDTEEGVNGADDQPIRAIHPHPGIC
jgi:hypothetical protein